MKTEQLIKIFETFFPEVPMRSKFDNDHIQLYYISDNLSYTVLYSKKINNLEVFKYDLKQTYPLTTIIEGSPEDILKLAKLLKND